MGTFNVLSESVFRYGIRRRGNNGTLISTPFFLKLLLHSVVLVGGRYGDITEQDNRTLNESSIVFCNNFYSTRYRCKRKFYTKVKTGYRIGLLSVCY